ncbi:ABC transporter ATP-binding protein [Marinobacter salinexigens]|uniref:ABC transporter ATP-binding protein n=1 Tax=Marinobacter salinexigens TaxID=2919747 RepID=A0A5B0V8S2_9GAMM|nr:ATP-binding cassette domain-containing protein [Marinobacter salinexigens]KAA1170563.1 ABC transporter ATP-binding protein [Marinobacter salinexigens]
MTAIVLDNVCKTFGKTPALAGVSGEIAAGRLTGLVGPDGAGKTTLIRLMAGLLAPDEGRLSVAGLDPVVDGDALAESVGYMPQRFGLYEDLSVLENLHLYAELRALPRRDYGRTLDRLLEFTRLGPFTDRLAGRLSGGMKQKLGLACALITSPKVLLLDEPGVGVDPVSRQDLWRMVQELTAEGMAVIWATAYLEEAERCEDVLLLNEGKLTFRGPPGDLTRRLQGRCFQVLGQDDRRNLLSRVLALPGVCDGTIEGDRIRVVMDAGVDLPDLPGVTDVRPVPPRFEDAFIDLLGGGPGGHSPLAEQMPESTARDDTVSCEKLTRRFGDFVAADEVSFSVKSGEILGLLGPNGAGKSTTFKMLCGLLEPSGGEARVAGVDLRRAASDAKLKLGYMAQKFSLYGLLSVRQNLAFYAGVYGLRGRQKRERISQMVEALQLGPLLNRSPDQLSLGFKQRLALACALMHRPPILFLDEPTSGVDPITRREFWTHINGLVTRGVTVLVTTHFMDEAEYCDRVALMHRGRIIALDTPDNLKARAGEGASMEQAFIHLIEGQGDE